MCTAESLLFGRTLLPYSHPFNPTRLFPCEPSCDRYRDYLEREVRGQTTSTFDPLFSDRPWLSAHKGMPPSLFHNPSVEGDEEAAGAERTREEQLQNTAKRWAVRPVGK